MILKNNGLFPVKDKRTPPSTSKMYKIIFSSKSTCNNEKKSGDLGGSLRDPLQPILGP